MFENMSWYDKLPSENMQVCDDNLYLFFDTMYERQIIWYKRFIEKLPAPWAENLILRNYKFTNVYRELDRSSQFLINNIILDKRLDIKNLVWKIMVYRYFNNPETFTFSPEKIDFQTSLFDTPVKSGLKQIKHKKDLISAAKWRNGIPDYEEYDEEEFSKFIAGVRSAGQNPFTNAYLINSMAAPGQSRDYCYTRVIIPFLHKNLDNLLKVIKKAKTAEEIIEFIKTFPGAADFIAHEFYQDFTYIARYTDKTFFKFDQNDFTNVGPGASVGIRLIFPSLKAKDQKQAIYWLKTMADIKLAEIGKQKRMPFPYLYWDKVKEKYVIGEDEESFTNQKRFHGYGGITLHQIEMWLCEFQKYWKMSIGEGKQRSKFIPKS